MWFRYQEFDEGIHNFDDKHIFTIALLRFMREYMKVNDATAFAASPRPFYSQPVPRLYPVVNYPGTRDVYPHIPPLCFRLEAGQKSARSTSGREKILSRPFKVGIC